MMRVRNIEQTGSPRRLYAVMACMGIGFLVLTGTLFRLQVARVSQFESRQKIQSLRRVRLPGIRGKIYDRNGLCLADNRPTYSIALFPEEIRCSGAFSKTIDRAHEVMCEVAGITGLDPVLSREDIRKHINWYRPYPLILWRDVSAQAMARVAEQGTDIPGADIYVQATRTYPYGPQTAHLIGYAREAEPDPENEERYNYYLPEISGHAGLEKLFDPFLRGEAGAKLVQVDVAIYRHGELAVRSPKAGGDLRLTIDIDVQMLAQDALEGCRGAVVVLDPDNGDVLAMVSAPGFDSNLFVPYITTKDWNRLSEDPASPMLNRAVAGQYPPGSTFKPLVGLAAATADPSAPRTVYDCPGSLQVGNRAFHDWNPRGHGKLNMRQALEESANTYFFKTALHCGWRPIIEQARAVGLGQKTGVEVGFEEPGLVPDDQWKRSDGRGGWSDGDTCNLAIGQGYLLVTPVQMAMVTATIANGGWLYRPRLVQAYRPSEEKTFIDNPSRRVGKMAWPAEALNAVRGGMRDVVMSPKGTGRNAAVEGLVYAGKTGTAEYGRISEGKKHTWMIAFAPFDEPKYAVAFLIEDGVSGGTTVAPRMKILMEGLYEKMKREGRVQQRTEVRGQKSEIGSLKPAVPDPSFINHHSSISPRRATS
jgi:penicillin-binding protein 2